MKLYSLKDNLKHGLKRARKKAGYTQEELAKKIHVSLKSVMNWEQGISQPSLETLCELADLYKCDLDYLIGRIECKSHDIQFIHEQTGLNQKAIENLQDWNMQDDRRKQWGGFLSDWITNIEFAVLMSMFSEFKGFEKMEEKGRKLLSPSELEQVSDNRIARLWYISKTFTNIIESTK